jgi:hypothetical protein
MRIRAAASSIASGRPSSFPHSSATVPRFAPVTPKDGATSRARS